MILPVVLNILKIAGIVLLSLIGFILFVVLLVLFVPIRYNVRFNRTGADGDPPVDARGYVSWLLHIVHVSLLFPDDDGHYVIIRIFGIPIKRIPANEEELARQKEKQLKKLKKQAEKQKDTLQSEIHGSADAVEDGVSGEDERGLSDGESAEDEYEEQISSEELPTEEELENLVAEDEKVSIFSRIADSVNKIVCTIRTTCDKIRNGAVKAEEAVEKIRFEIHYYHRILTSELFERTFEKCKKRLFKLLRSIAPRKCDIYAEAGFDDPYTTGELLAIAGILYPYIGDHVRVVGNFDESVIRASGHIRGRIRIISFAIVFLFYLTDRDLKKTIRLLKKEPPKKKKKEKGNKEEMTDG